ncbi:MAG: glycosyltransferase family 8 protein [Bacteroidales bacterium]|jgi:lipopolysaccharide biosynthesis glycosyltransferase|nr:glycosyltransferase family 8 protein [Bacteroidales bacterium]MCI2122079.1 glycosyltransferase family 8 protein [Bacteroidales bacterium]MCI2146318.1 glycosyltransferase family 8 protein [Bacteroidales bacterium]
MKKRETIPVFFAIDDGYARFVAVAIKSLIVNASREYDYKIIVLGQEVSKDNVDRISALSEKGFEIEFVPMKDKFDGITNWEGSRLRADYFTLTIYFRLFIPDMFPQYDKGIYLDSDIVLPGDISEMYRTKLGDNLLAASVDHSIQHIPELVRYIENAIGVKVGTYFNSGVLLMNLKRLREARLSTRFLELFGKYHFDTEAPDQDYLNVLCHGKVVYLDECWDAMPKNYAPELEHPKLIHYNLFSKPWCYDGVQYAGYFWKYARLTGYYDELVDFKKNYSDEQKKADGECMADMCRRSDMVSRNTFTFKTLFDSGQEKRL